MTAQIYERSAPFVRHAGCAILWRMRPYITFAGGRPRLSPFVPEPYAYEDWPDWAKRIVEQSAKLGNDT